MSDLLTPHFSRWEFTTSQTAARLGLANIPNDEQWANLKALSLECLEPAREALGPLRISSGYRSPALNGMIGGSPTSQHMLGEAADVIPLQVSLGELYRWLYANTPYWQLIHEFGEWVHVSYKRDVTPRLEPLIATKLNGRTVYTQMSKEQVETL